MNPLLDSEFLIKLNNDRNRTIYAHVISLNQYEHPIEQLEGVVTAGSITIDGQSAVRRVCSLTLSAKNLNINNVYWALTTKVKIEIGLQNNIDKKYDDIIWFPQGIFILTDFKTTQTINNYTINLSGKDKMCLLNGDVSGNLPAPVRFDSYTDASKQSYTIGSSNLFPAKSYNNFTDDVAAEAILAGFQERYGSDYQFIRGAKKILSLQYIPNGNIAGTIKFNQSDTESTPLANIVSKSSTENENVYDVNLDDKDIYGFIAEGCNNGDQFIWVIEQKIPIGIIIQEILHQFGQERYSNIIIRDIDPYALEMLDSAYNKNYYLLHDGDIYSKFISEDQLISQQKFIIYETGKTLTSENMSSLIFRNYVDEDDISIVDIIQNSTQEKNKTTPTKIIENGIPEIKYTIQPVKPEEVAGYGMTLLVYPDELIGQPGDSITSILDKIINMLGDYEYFYDLNGQFIFQAKPAYIKTAWNNRIFLNEENYIEAGELTNRVAYTFDDSTLTTQYQNSPNMNNIKNDYIIWGERKSLSGNTIKIHGRYAIENIPLEYTDFNGYTWTSSRTESLISSIYKKQEYAIKNYQHIYNYPPGYDPLEQGWWEVNDWANFYQSIFGINISKSHSYMYQYHENYSQEEKNEAKEIFISYFLSSYGSDITNFTSTDLITLCYTKDKVLKNIYDHGGKCTHFYCQFMDLRNLNQGWDYGTTASSANRQEYPIINAWDPTKKFTLDNGNKVSIGYHPDYTLSFIYKPILPSDLNIYSSEIISDIIYADVYNMNGKKRMYALTEDVDWRHLIHIMADDWYQHHTEDDYEINLRQNNNWPELNIDLFPYGRTGYEQYYLDFTSIGGFWQNLYDIYSVYDNYYKSHTDLHNILYYQNKEDQAIAMLEEENYLSQFFSGGTYKYWHKDVIDNPENLIFWFDFFKADEMGIGKFATSVIGDRPKTINDTAIKNIIYRDTPDVIYCSWSEYQNYKAMMVLKDGYKYIIIGNNDKSYLADRIEDILANGTETQKINLLNELNNFPQNIKQNFVRSIRHKTVHDQADNMLYQYSYYNDTVNISNVPIYYLQPNTIISTKDELSRVTGYYVINKINISLAYNGLMQITAIKSPERIY